MISPLPPPLIYPPFLPASVQVSPALHLCPFVLTPLRRVAAGRWVSAGCHGHRAVAWREEASRPARPNCCSLIRCCRHRCPHWGLWGPRHRRCSYLHPRQGTLSRPAGGAVTQFNSLVLTKRFLLNAFLFTYEAALKLTLTSVRDSWMSRVKRSCWASPSASASSVWTPLTSLACTLSNHKKGVPFLDAADGGGDLKINSPLSYNPIGSRRRLADGGPSRMVFISLQLCHQ